MVQSLFSGGGEDAVRVALPLPLTELFDYAVPEAWAGRARPGCRVQVRFRERPLTGIVVERGRGGDFAGGLRPIEAVVDAEPVLSETLLQVIREMAEEVLCPLGIALATALPSGSAPRRVPGYAITARGREALRAGALRGPSRGTLEHLSRRPATGSDLRRHAGHEQLSALERDGLLARHSLELPPRARAATRRTLSVAPGTDVEATARGPLARAPKQAALLRRLARSGPVPARSLAPEFSPAVVRALLSRGLLRDESRPAPRDVLGTPLERPGRVSLTAEQASALKPIVEAVGERRFETYLLHGVTGSGKTEVYLQAVAAALSAGRQALVLVPEITLTHQILARLRARFGDELAVLHSGLRPGERLEQWQRLRDGVAPVAVGARSALFAPLENLGVIAVDEEHDTAYKNDEGFRYHARDLAAGRARAARCPLILGSATPSLETRYAADRGVVHRLELSSRIGDRPLPAVEIVDLAAERERAPRGRKLILSETLRRAMDETLEQGGQTILFLNRRGFSTRIFCFDCGHAEHCRDCDIALVYHAAEQKLRCHYCDFRIDPPESCSGCGAPDTALLGLGTERVAEEVRVQFPGARIRRLDRDTARRRGHVESALRDLRDGRVDVLIGTQMVAKGHDFPGVRLVGVVAADVGLHLPDFRAAERTFQLLTQVAGRAGRDLAPGRVVIQTFCPDHYAIRPVGEHDYEGFYARELRQRAELGFPPFGHLAHAVVSGEDELATREATASLAESVSAAGLLGEPGPGGLELLGPAPCPLARLRRRYRFQLLVKGADADRVHRAAAFLARAAARLPEPFQASLDANPLNLL